MIKPAMTPQQKIDKSLEILRANNVETDRCCLLGIRGYYKHTMGKPDENDRRIYDDALFIVSPNCYMAFNANVDPNGYRPGHGTAESTKGMANLKCGVWTYQLGIHRTYLALTQADAVTVIRDGTPSYEHTGWFGINIHRGGWESTSSLGCQTIYPSQWDSFIATVQREMTEFNQKTIKYVLIENKD